VALASFGVCSEWGHLHETERVIRVIGLVSVPLLAWAGVALIRRETARYGAVAAATLLLVQSQVDMLAWQPATVVWVLAVVGASSVVPACGRIGASWLASGAAVVLAGTTLAAGWWPAALSARVRMEAADQLLSAPGDAGPRAEAEVRALVSDRLDEAWVRTADPRLVLAAADQQLAAARGLAGSEPHLAVGHLEAARTLAAKAADQGAIAGLWLEIRALHGLARVRGRASDLDAGLSAAELLVTKDPVNPLAWVTLARVAMSAGDVDAAGAAWRMALELDDQQVIDPVQRLSASVRRDAEAFLSGSAPR